jgi:pimeloyl-ACP methyl ester carboxylesterase
MRAMVISATLLLSGCAAPPAWRLTNKVLVPPGIAGPGVAQRTFTADIEAGGGTCPPEIRVRGRRVQVTVSRDTLLKQPAGWLTAWTEELEASKCISPREGPKLAGLIAGSLPLDPNAAFKLLNAGDRLAGADLGPGIRLQVVSPILVDGKSFEPPVPVEEPTGTGKTLNLTFKVPNLLGVETDLYGVRQRAGRPGFVIVPLGADRKIDGKTEHVSQPATNYFQFSENAAFYRLFFKAGQSEFTALVVAGRTRAELEAAVLNPALASCMDLPPGMCVTLPKHVAVNSMIAVTVNGKEALVNWGSTVDAAIRASGERQPGSVLPRLSLSRPHDGKLVAVDFDRSDPAILGLVLAGGENISWTAPSLVCTGKGGPTVLIVGGGFASDWILVQNEVQKFARVCTYDPPDPSCSSRVSEIHAMHAGSPYVLVGLSVGAVVARLYAKQYPQDVAGMVIVDHAFIDIGTKPTPVTTGPVLLEMTPIVITAADDPGFRNLPEYAQKLHQQTAALNPALPTVETARACLAQAGQASLHNLPLAVVSTGNEAPNYPKLQQQLLALSTHSKQFIAARSFHSVEMSQPDVIVSAIRYVLGQ